MLTFFEALRGFYELLLPTEVDNVEELFRSTFDPQKTRALNGEFMFSLIRETAITDRGAIK